MNDHLIFVRKGAPNEYYNRNFISNKTCSHIAQDLDLDEEILAIQTDKCREIIDPECKILDVHPDLLLKKRPEKFERPVPFLAIVPKTEFNTITLFVDVVPQQGLDCPYFEAQINLQDIENKTVKELFNVIDSSFIMEHDCSVLKYKNEDVDMNMPALQCIELAKKDRLTLHVLFPEKVVKACHYRTLILSEIVKTEDTYISGLNRLISFWQPNCLSAGLLTEEESNEIFKHFPVILACHTRFYGELVSKTTKFSAQVAEVLLNFSEFFKPSSYYIGVYNTYIALINKKKKNPSFMKNMMEVAQKNPYDKAEILTSLLITPVQRMPRYILFIKELIKKTPKCHPDYTLLLTASVYIDNVTREIEVKAEHAEDNQKMLELESRLTKQFPIFSETRHIEKVLDINIIKSEKDLIPGKIYFITDLLLVTSVDKKEMEIVMWGGPISDFSYANGSNPKIFNIWWEPEAPKMTEFEFIDEKDLNNFLEILKQKRTTDNVNSFAEPFKLRDPLPSVKGNQAVLINDILYSFGGMNGDVLSSQLFMINTSVKTVTQIASPLPPRKLAAIAKNGDTIYVFGGTDGESFFNDLWEYNLLTATWKQLPSDAKGRAGHTLSVYGRFAFAFGGFRGSKYLQTMSIYNMARMNWHSAVFRGGPSRRAFHSAAIVNRSLVVMGGKNNMGLLGDFGIFDVSKIYWRTFKLSVAATPRAFHVMHPMGTSLLLMGGEYEEGGSFAELVDLSAQRATALPINGPLPHSLLLPMSGINNNVVFVIGGTDRSQKTSLGTSFRVTLDERKVSEMKEKKEVPEFLKTGSFQYSIVQKRRKMNSPMARISTLSPRRFAALESKRSNRNSLISIDAFHANTTSSDDDGFPSSEPTDVLGVPEGIVLPSLLEPVYPKEELAEAKKSSEGEVPPYSSDEDVEGVSSIENSSEIGKDETPKSASGSTSETGKEEIAENEEVELEKPPNSNESEAISPKVEKEVQPMEPETGKEIAENEETETEKYSNSNESKTVTPEVEKEVQQMEPEKENIELRETEIEKHSDSNESEEVIPKVEKEIQQMESVKVKEKANTKPSKANVEKPPVIKTSPTAKDRTKEVPTKGEKAPDRGRSVDSVFRALSVDPSGVLPYQRAILQKKARRLLELERENAELRQRLLEEQEHSDAAMERRREPATVHAVVFAHRFIRVVPLRRGMTAEEVGEAAGVGGRLRAGRMRRPLTTELLAELCNNKRAIKLYAL